MVIVPTLTFIAAVNPVRYQFAEHVFMECDFDGAVLVHNTSRKIVKAVVVVHVFENLADMEAIMDIARQHHLKVIEDATEALGTRYTAGRYDGELALKYFRDITLKYYQLMDDFMRKAAEYY